MNKQFVFFVLSTEDKGSVGSRKPCKVAVQGNIPNIILPYSLRGRCVQESLSWCSETLC